MNRLAFILTFSAWQLANAQPFAGTNAPGGATNYSLTVPIAATNVSLVVSNNATAYSHLLLKRNGTPTDTDYDFISRLNGRTNQINLELPEFQTGNYGLRVRTPSGSLTQAFNVVMTTDRQDLRSGGYPVRKPHVFTTTGTLTNNLVSGTWHYFQVDIPTNLPGWRVVLSTNSGSISNPDLFIRRGQLPTQGIFDEGSQNQAIDTLILTDTEATNFTYFIGVYLPPTAAGQANYTLSTEIGYLTQLTWDPGTNHLGSRVFTNASLTGGDYFFRITTQSPNVGAWRTALYVDAGEADVSIRQNTFSESYSQYNYRQSSRIGSDGWVLHSSEFAAAQNWYIVVRATPGAQWRLFSGDVYVQNLGTLAADASSSSGPVPMGAEGMRFFRTTTTVNTLAWRLWLNGGNNQVLVRDTVVPHPRSTAYYDWQATGQILLVPNYLVGGRSYFVGVIGNPGETINLDSRQHGFTDLAFNSTTPVNLTGYGYTTYRVQVPVQQIAWLTTVTPSAGDANVAVRRDFIPNEFYNNGFSEVGGSTADSVSLVPPTLSDGTYYVTVWGNTPFTCSLFTGNPVITDVAFVSATQNNDLARVGWRYFRVPNISSQLGTLGWDLFLSNYVANTELAIRQNAVPSRWNFRNGSSNSSSSAHIDYTGGTSGFLQRPGHQADIWYVGVYNPGVALGPFWLFLQELQAALTSFDGGSQTRVGSTPQRWEYFRVNVPVGCLGWDVRLVNVLENGALPLMIVRRDQLPDGLTTTPWSSPQNSTTWPSGYRWRAGNDWTDRQLNSSGSVNESSRILAMGIGRPLEPGTYYVGVNNQNANPMTFTIQSRGIGSGFTIPVTPLAFAGGSATNTLAPREAAYYSVNIPSSTPSWKVKMRAAAGESLLIVLKDVIPSVLAGDSAAVGLSDSGHKMQKIDDEHWLLLPQSGQTNIAAGTYYLAVASEGMNATNTSRIGIGTSTHEVTSLGTLPVTAMGTLAGPDLTQAGTLVGGEASAYQFSVPAGTLAMEVWLENKVGDPGMALIPSVLLPQPNNTSYGTEGGHTPARLIDDTLINVANPTPTTWSVVVKANGTGQSYPAASYTLRVHRLFPTNIVFDSGTIDATNHLADTWRYFRVDVPAGPLGWDIRLVNVATNCEPRMVIRRDFAPGNLSTTPWSSPNNNLSWPTGYQWAATYDWSARQFNPSGAINEYGRILAMGMGRPLEPGTYYVGVINVSGTNSMAYTVLSRGIGTNFTIPVSQIAFAGGSYTTNGLPAREAAYFCVNVPSNTPTWKIKLSTNASESLLIVLRNALPGVSSSDNAAAGPNDSGAEMQKAGNEHFLLLPQSGETNIPAGNYYFAVVAEGTNATNSSRIGAGSSSFTIESLGPLTVTDLGVLTPVDIVQPGALEGGEVAAYQFTVPPGTLGMEVRLENRVGNPTMALRPGARVPQPNACCYGQEGGWTAGRLIDDQLITVPNPSNGVWSLVVKASLSGSIYSNATYNVNVRITTVTATPVTFDGGSLSVTGHPAGTWRYLRVDVPVNAFGWDVRIINVPTNGNNPRMVIRRDQLPASLSTTPWSSPESATAWPSGYHWAATHDWSERQFSPNGQQDEYGHILAMGMGRPLEPGTYYLGVINSGSDTNPLAYTVFSRGIGTNMSIGITPLDFLGGTTNHPGLPAREAAYFSVDVPSNSPSWKVRLAATSGDTVLLALRDVLPSIRASGYAAYPSFNNSGARMKKDGNEHFVLIPYDPQTNVPAGRYYLAVGSEGMNLTNANRIGIGASSFTLTSQGTLPVYNLGTIGSSAVSHTLEGGELRAYQFNVASGVQAFEALLENRVGNPSMALRFGTGLPSDPSGYGVEGGFGSGRIVADTILTVANPSNSTYSLTVKALAVSSTYPDASYTLRVQAKTVADLSFAPGLNTATQTNVAGQLLADDQRAFYRVVVPGFYNGHDVIGWRLLLSQSSGQANVRVRRDFLPTDTGSSFQSPFGQGDYLIVAPYLTPGTWYVEVRATGSTEFSLESNELLLERPTWTMQQAGQPTTTPGLVAPNFGDTGVDVAGNPLSGDQGIDLARNFFHYYAVTVPGNNSGVMRVVLEAINGNPDFYMRTSAPPTLVHGPTGPFSGIQLYQRYLNDTTTEYANWVNQNGRYERELTPGVYYIAIRAVTSNVRYRMRLSAGDIQNLALDGGSYNNQILAAGDWRYYRLYVPTNAPRNWNVTFNQIVGNVVMHVRDTSPPGQGDYVSDYVDWQDDSKNHSTYPNYDPAGTHTIGCPPLRPGHTYYLGFRAVNDATFSVSSGVSAANIDVTNVVQFYGGVTNTTIAANGSLRFRVDVPPEARRWIHYATNAASVRIYIDQGSCPSLTSSDHYACSSANCTANHDLYSANNWPWLPGYMYYVTVTNTSGSVQPFYFRMDGRDCYNFPDDQDNDLLPDCWELTYWPSISSYTTLSDPDNDGLPNLYEYLNGSNPTTPDSFYLTDWATLSDRNYQFRFVGPTNGRYRIQAAPALTGTWTQIRFFTNTTGTALITDTNATNFPNRFYRARSQ